MSILKVNEMRKLIKMNDFYQNMSSIAKQCNNSRLKYKPPAYSLIYKAVTQVGPSVGPLFLKFTRCSI